MGDDGAPAIWDSLERAADKEGGVHESDLGGRRAAFFEARLAALGGGLPTVVDPYG
jgi:hypothetical protein